jgi:hypothetical protein
MAKLIGAMLAVCVVMFITALPYVFAMVAGVWLLRALGLL